MKMNDAIPEMGHHLVKSHFGSSRDIQEREKALYYAERLFSSLPACKFNCKYADMWQHVCID